ncbi:MAG: helix-turn-helix transcriptional regulator [Bacteroidota bacterium]|nr:helix-turn-helix transcriptional regulator [Bacteroidota bacterium]
MDKKQFGTLIKDMRVAKGFTQEKLSEIAGIDYKYLQNLEYGKHIPSLDIVFKLANALNLKGWEFVKTFEEANKSQS